MYVYSVEIAFYGLRTSRPSTATSPGSMAFHIVAHQRTFELKILGILPMQGKGFFPELLPIPRSKKLPYTESDP